MVLGLRASEPDPAIRKAQRIYWASRGVEAGEAAGWGSRIPQAASKDGGTDLGERSGWMERPFVVPRGLEL